VKTIISFLGALAVAAGMIIAQPGTASATARCDHGTHTHPHGNHTHRWSFVDHWNEGQWHVHLMRESTHETTDKAYC
jgi:hypothetical protein